MFSVILILLRKIHLDDVLRDLLQKSEIKNIFLEIVLAKNLDRNIQQQNLILLLEWIQMLKQKSKVLADLLFVLGRLLWVSILF